jgi:hypothetical protein
MDEVIIHVMFAGMNSSGGASVVAGGVASEVTTGAEVDEVAGATADIAAGAEGAAVSCAWAACMLDAKTNAVRRIEFNLNQPEAILATP